MADYSDKYGIVFQNLIDAGCDEDAAKQYAQIILAGNTNQALQILGTYRKQLLDEVHTNKKRIDCLDFLIYKVGKSEI